MTDRENKAQWKAPVVSRLGNVRDWVREGGAKGKSGVDEDGGTSGSNEAMAPMA